uniref:MORN repeat containing 4 n=1 Tax=Sus scrofa TaxID=9823 RepID=A0A4X1U7Z4_PIG
MTWERKPWEWPHHLPGRASISGGRPLQLQLPALSFPSLARWVSPSLTLWSPSTDQLLPSSHFLFCRVMQNLSLLLLIGADDPSPRSGPGLCAALERKKGNDRGSLDIHHCGPVKVKATAFLSLTPWFASGGRGGPRLLPCLTRPVLVSASCSCGFREVLLPSPLTLPAVFLT